MPTAIEHARAVRQLPVVYVLHVLSGEEKDDHDRESKYQVESFHGGVSAMIGAVARPWGGRPCLRAGYCPEPARRLA